MTWHFRSFFFSQAKAQISILFAFRPWKSVSFVNNSAHSLHPEFAENASVRMGGKIPFTTNGCCIVALSLCVCVCMPNDDGNSFSINVVAPVRFVCVGPAVEAMSDVNPV